MSAFGGKADITRTCSDVRFRPKADMGSFRLLPRNLIPSDRRVCRRAKAPPSGPGWIREIKHDGFCILARRDSAVVRLITRDPPNELGEAEKKISCPIYGIWCEVCDVSCNPNDSVSTSSLRVKPLSILTNKRRRLRVLRL